MTKNQKYLLAGALGLTLLIVAYKKGWIGKKEDPFVIADTSAESQTKPLRVA